MDVDLAEEYVRRRDVVQPGSQLVGLAPEHAEIGPPQQQVVDLPQHRPGGGRVAELDVGADKLQAALHGVDRQRVGGLRAQPFRAGEVLVVIAILALTRRMADAPAEKGVKLGDSVLLAGYAMGTPARMGPAFFPFWLGLILILIFYRTLDNPFTGDSLLPAGGIRTLGADFVTGGNGGLSLLSLGAAFCQRGRGGEEAQGVPLGLDGGWAPANPHVLLESRASPWRTLPGDRNCGARGANLRTPGRAFPAK